LCCVEEPHALRHAEEQSARDREREEAGDGERSERGRERATLVRARLLEEALDVGLHRRRGVSKLAEQGLAAQKLGLRALLAEPPPRREPAPRGRSSKIHLQPDTMRKLVSGRSSAPLGNAPRVTVLGFQ